MLKVSSIQVYPSVTRTAIGEFQKLSQGLLHTVSATGATYLT